MRTTTNGGIKATYPDAEVWKQERQLIYIERVSGAATEIFFCDYDVDSSSRSNPLAVYTLDSNGKVTIDITDFVRTYVGSTLHTLWVGAVGGSGADDIGIGIKTIGLISPDEVIIPPHDYMDYALIVPPFKMIMADDYFPPRFEFYSENAVTFTIDQYSGNALSLSSAIPNKGSFGLDDTVIDKFSIEEDNYGHVIWRVLTPQQCGVRYARVRWISFTGQERTHYFEVSKAKTESASTYSLMPIANEYIDIKGKVDGLTLRLTGLCAYDIWYYSDLITSSNVQVSIGLGSFTRVQVTSKSITLPDGEAHDGVLEINVNWKRYDAVAM